MAASGAGYHGPVTRELAAAATAVLFLSLALAAWWLDRRPRDPPLSERTARVAPVGVLDLDAVYGQPGRAALLAPSEILPQTQRYPAKDVRAVLRYARRCGPPPAEVAAPLAKTLVWHRFACGDLAALPEGFFERPPFVHPLGRSFAALAIERGVAAPTDALHVLEAPADTPDRRLLAALGPELLAPILAGRREIVGARHVLRLTAPGSGPAALGTWTVWSRRDLEALTRPRLPLLAPGLAVAGGTLLLALVGWLLVARVRGRAREAAARQFALRTLTHELRTPVTGLTLALEPLRDHYDALPPDCQEPFLRVCSGVSRLERVVETSARYLALHQNGEPFARVAVPSAVAFLSDLLEPYGGQVALTAPVDAALETDPRWLAICLRNLIENALQHGQAPVTVQLSPGPPPAIAVRDAGVTPAGALATMASAFERGPASNGLGLGLAIATQVARGLGGTLTHEGDPTTFRVTLGGGR